MTRTLFMLFCALACLSAPPARAQEPDTLDPRGYFPLEVGNTWEYAHHRYRPASLYRPHDESKTLLEHYRILSSHSLRDTTFYDMLVYVLDEQSGLVERDTVRIWYDASHASIEGEARSIIAWLKCLDAPFGTSGDSSGECWPFVGREEAYDETLFGISEAVPAKGFASFVWAFRVVHGVGIVDGGGGCEPCGPFDDTDYWHLKYTRVGEREYGARIVGTERVVAASEKRLTVYPNPASGGATFETGGAGRLEVFDVLGRRVEVVPIGPAGEATVDLTGYAPGTYLARFGSRVRLFVVGVL